jgi:hypothetical protein
LQVGIDNAEKVSVALCPSVNHSASEPALTVALKDAHARITQRTLPRNIRCAVGAAVIDDNEFAIDRRILHRSA